MNFGFRITNPDGGILVDENARSQWLWYSGTVSAVAGRPVGAYHVVNFPQPLTTDDPPTVAGRWWPYTTGVNAYIAGLEVIGAPGRWTGFRIYSTTLPGPPAPELKTIEFRVYRSGATNERFGVRVFTPAPARAVAFDSGAKPLEVERFLPPGGWTLNATSSPSPGVRYVYLSKPNPYPTGFMMLSAMRWGSLAYPSGEGSAPLALVSYMYNLQSLAGGGATLAAFLSMNTFSASTPNPLSQVDDFPLPLLPATS